MDCYQSLFRVVLMGVVAEKQRFVASAMGLHWVLSLSMFRHSAFALTKYLGMNCTPSRRYVQ